MKHLLNDLSEEEKNRIREQHTGGKKIVIENFNKLVNSKLGDAKPFLTEGIVEKGDEYIWCKTNVTDKTNQICVIKTPSSLDKMGCQTQTGNYARNKQYVNPIKIDVSETNVCKSVWEKMK